MANLFNVLKKSSTQQVDLINLVLLVLSFVLAVCFPFSLFLLAYAILGPLHYLTELFWLKKSNFYLKESKGSIPLIVFSVLLTLMVLLGSNNFFKDQPFMLNNFQPIITGILFLSFSTALIFTLIENRRFRFLAFVLAIILCWVLSKLSIYELFFGIFLTSIIHVSLFTALFMVFGALKAKSSWGFFTVVMYIVFIGFIFILPASYIRENISIKFQDILYRSGFILLNQSIADFFGATHQTSIQLTQGIGLRIQSFLAFIYTYHYLNWFSKVEVIRWHKVSSQARNITIGVWAIAVLLYYVNYQTGLLTLFLLSTLHVLLEFPLNIHSITGIVQQLKSKWYR
ncbi:MAG: hypothetical protein ACOYKE_11130 [Ferruginibacter sp.]